MTFQEIQEKLKKCELALTSIKDGTYSNTNFTKEEALEKFTTIKESLEKKLNLLKEEETMFVSTKGGDTKAVQMDTKAAMDLKKDPNITGITTAKGKDLKEDDLSDEEQEEITTETSHTEVVAKEVHKALIDALQETGHEVSEDNLSSLNPETFTITVRFKDNTQSDYSFEFLADEVKLDGNIIVTTNKKGVTPILNKTIAKDNLVKYFKNLSEKKGKDLDGDGDIDSDDYMIARDRAIKANMKEQESEPVVDKKGKYTGVRRLKLSDKDKATLKKIEDLLAKEKNESINEENYEYYTKPKHFDICPGAEALRDELLASGKTAEELGKWTFKHDELFRLEKAVLKSNKADERHVKVAKDLAGEITHHSRDLGIEANKIGYLKGHIKKIEDVAKKTDGRGDNMSLRSRDIYEATKEEEEEFHKKLDTLVHKTFGKRKEELEEAPEGMYYIKVPRKDKGLQNAVQNTIETFYHPVRFADIVDDDGDGNVIMYIHKKDFDPGMIDDLSGDGVDIEGMTNLPNNADLDEALDINDPALMRARVAKMRADDMKKLDALKKADKRNAPVRAIIAKLKAKRAEVEREMENDPGIEPEGGPVSDKYGDMLNKIDNAIEKAASKLVEEDDQFAGSDPKAGSTIKGKGFMAPRTFVDPEDLTPAAMAKKMLKKETIQVGHPDNEPGMLKQDAYDIAHYAVKLYKLLKYYDSLEDQVDFPHWWQSKVVKAREYISKAAHYLEFKTNEPAIDSHVDALQEGRSANAIKKEYDALVKKMIELAKEYKQAEGDKKQKLVDQLKDHTKKKKELEKELDQAVQKTGAGQELDTSLNELSGDQTDALYELQNILDDVAQKGEEAREIIRQSFPRMLSKADAYGAFDFGSSSNRYDTTLASIIEEIEEYYDEEEDLDEIGMFHDPIGYSSTAAAEDKRALQLVKDLISKGVNKEDAIEKAAEKFKLRVNYLTRYVNKSIDEAVTHDFEERIDQIVNHYFKGDQEVKKAAVEYASLKAARTMGGRSATASYFKDFFNNYSDEVANQAMEVIDMADDDVYQEGNYKSDAQRKAIYATKAEKGELKEENGLKEFEKEYLSTQFGDSFADDFPNTKKYSIESLYAAFEELHKKKGYDYEEFFELVDNGKIKRHSASKLLKLKAEKGELKNVIDEKGVDTKTADIAIKKIGKSGKMPSDSALDYLSKEYFNGNIEKAKEAIKTSIEAYKFAATDSLEEAKVGEQLFNYFQSQGYDITKRRPDGYPPKEGVEGYQVSRGNDRYPQSVIFQHNKDTDEFTISRMSGYRIDEKEAIKAGMREKGRSGAAGMDSYMTDGNYTPADISAEGLKDIVDHVMSGLDRESKAQADFYGARGRTSGTIDEGATCCGRCGRVHVKGTKCKRPFLTGKDHCRNN